ncbi:hypothetical protein Hanom_Chr09g00830511 [Helianthus anomalus]
MNNTNTNKQYQNQKKKPKQSKTLYLLKTFFGEMEEDYKVVVNGFSPVTSTPVFWKSRKRSGN